MGETGHISDYTLDRLRAGELSGAREQQVRTHLEACETCRQRAAELDAQVAEFAAELPVPEVFAHDIASRPTPRERRSLTRPLGIGLAAAAAAVVVLYIGLKPPDVNHGRQATWDRIVWKGSPDLEFWVKADGQVHKGMRGESLREGDSIRLAVGTTRHEWLFIVSVADNGEITPLYPDGQGKSIVLTEPSSPLMLDGSIILDDYLGDERLFALFSDSPLTTEQVVAAARQALAEARDRGEGVQDIRRLPIDTTQATTWFRKE